MCFYKAGHWKISGNYQFEIIPHNLEITLQSEYLKRKRTFVQKVYDESHYDVFTDQS